jgi:hypothetical protein
MIYLERHITIEEKFNKKVQVDYLISTRPCNIRHRKATSGLKEEIF